MAKGDGHVPLRTYIAAMPGWNRDLERHSLRGDRVGTPLSMSSRESYDASAPRGAPPASSNRSMPTTCRLRDARSLRFRVQMGRDVMHVCVQQGDGFVFLGEIERQQIAQ